MGKELVNDVRCMLACVQRMHLGDRNVIFWNETREFKIVMRNVPVQAGRVYFDIGILWDKCDDDDDSDGDFMGDDGSINLGKVLELDGECYTDKGCFTIAEYEFELDALAKDPQLLDGARRKLNELYGYTVCPCGLYFIKDCGPMCMFCQLTNASIDEPLHFCPICHEKSIERHMVKQPCCQKPMHQKCITQWLLKRDTCPLCNAVVDP